jgi:hypothetical protein
MPDMTPAALEATRVAQLEQLVAKQQQAIEFLAALNGLPTPHGQIHYRMMMTDGVTRTIAPGDVRVSFAAGHRLQSRTTYVTDWVDVERSWNAEGAA